MLRCLALAEGVGWERLCLSYKVLVTKGASNFSQRLAGKPFCVYPHMPLRGNTLRDKSSTRRLHLYKVLVS